MKQTINIDGQEYEITASPMRQKPKITFIAGCAWNVSITFSKEMRRIGNAPKQAAIYITNSGAEVAALSIQPTGGSEQNLIAALLIHAAQCIASSKPEFTEAVKP